MRKSAAFMRRGMRSTSTRPSRTMSCTQRCLTSKWRSLPTPAYPTGSVSQERNPTPEQREASDLCGKFSFSRTQTYVALSATGTMATKATGFPALVFFEPPASSRIDCVVVFLNSPERLFFSLSYLLPSRNGSIFLLGPCQKFVV